MSLDSVWRSPTDEHSSAEFSFSHQDEHVKAADAVFKKFGVNLLIYSLDPMPPLNDRGAWGNMHQAMHNDLDAVLGLASGPDLSAIDWSDPEQVTVWTQLHSPRHQLYAQTLGLT